MLVLGRLIEVLGWKKCANCRSLVQIYSREKHDKGFLVEEAWRRRRGGRGVEEEAWRMSSPRNQLLSS